MEKIAKIAEIFSEASADEKPKILAQIEKRLKTAATQSFGDEGGKYVDIIMQGVKLRAINSTINRKSQKSFDTSLIDKHESGEEIVKAHVTRTITDKIESFAKKYLRMLNTIGEKRTFLENVRKKMLEIAEIKKIKLFKDDMNYNEIITNSINDILKRNLEENSRRAFVIIKESEENQKQNLSTHLIHPSEEKDTLNYIKNHQLDSECIVSVALICSKVESLNKFTCPAEEKIINTERMCDGVKDCLDGADEDQCHKLATERLNLAKNSLFEMNRSFEQNCLLGKTNETFTHQEIVSDWLKAQLDVIDDYNDIFQHNNDTESYKETMKKVVDILNKIILNLNKGICSRQEKSKEIVAGARQFHLVLDQNIENVLRESALFPKSCACDEERCVSRICVKSCEKACIHKFNLGRWTCPSVNGSVSVHLNTICDGKLDCYDESDERDCNAGNGRGKFDANEGFQQIIKLLEMKMASKENAHVRNELLRLYNSIIKLQNLITESKLRVREIKLIRDKCFALLSLIYGNYMKTSYNSNNADVMYRFLNSVNQVLVKALKQSHTGNNKIILTYNCICRNNKCIRPKCSTECSLACEVENQLSRFYCKNSPRNQSVAVEAICNGTEDCADGDDEANCNEEVCRRHHLYYLRTSIQDVGKKHEGTMLGEVLKFWRMKATSMLLVAEKLGRRSPQFFRIIVKDMLKDLVHVYASFVANRKRSARTSFGEFSKISKNVMNALRSCGK
ncbi:LDL receptor repeat-containing protein egg-2-like [Battus philenor]|uniref:LDL receptor repeat-containing protein egg-2-like n=1 Tax=Battus philenor TaxID=42288 RepID=UPI0035CF9117